MTLFKKDFNSPHSYTMRKLQHLNGDLYIFTQLQMVMTLFIYRYRFFSVFEIT